MKVVFRADASNQMGTGHVMRCLSLAEVLLDRGVEIHFICRAHSGNLIEMLNLRSIPVTVLPAPKQSIISEKENYSAWLGVSQKEDALQTCHAIGDNIPDWLVVDHYALDSQWEQYLRPRVRKLMVIDDLANRTHICGLLLDQNYSEAGEDRYKGLVPKDCRVLAGPRYALLRPEYSVYRKTLPQRDGKVQRVLVYFGGPDPKNMTGTALEVLSAPEFEHLEVDVVVGTSNAHFLSIQKQVAQRPLTKYHGPRLHLADLMARCDLALGAGGSTTWERLCLGLPTLVVSVSQNQKPASKALSRAGLINYMGDVAEVGIEHLHAALGNWIGKTDVLQDISVRGQLLVDSMGVFRLAEALYPMSIDQLRLRVAHEDDVDLYFNWANDPEVRRQAIHTEVIPWVKHKGWFAEKLEDPQCHMFILMADTLPVGQIRFDCAGDEAKVDYSLDTLVRGRHWAGRLISLGVGMLSNITPTHIRAEVKEQNVASSAVFLRLGFEEQLDPPPPGRSKRDTRFSICILSDRRSWLNDFLPEIILGWLEEGHRVLWAHDKQSLCPANFCFYLACGEIVPAGILSQYQHNLVVHESDLPQGKGWSPMTWQILEGKSQICVTLFEATEEIDSGAIYLQERLEFVGDELIDELRIAQAGATLRLCKRFVDGYPEVMEQSRDQEGEENFYRRRGPEDSRLNPNQTLAEQFDLLRIADFERYPAFFELRGQCYQLQISKLSSLKKEF